MDQGGPKQMALGLQHWPDGESLGAIGNLWAPHAEDPGQSVQWQDGSPKLTCPAQGAGMEEASWNHLLSE